MDRQAGGQGRVPVRKQGMRLNTRGEYPYGWPLIAKATKDAASWRCVRCRHAHEPESGRTLTVHHWDGDKGNCRWWNLMPLCQACHLSIQGRVNPDQSYMFEHAEWCKPYAAGFYAWKYLRHQISREEAIRRMDELLALERVA